MTITYHPKTPESAHAYFVADGDLAGTWQFQSAPSAAQRLVIEDLALRVSWTVTPQLGMTGEPIVITARITEKGSPYRGEAQVYAQVRLPTEHQGDLIARGMRERRVQTRADGDASTRGQIISAILERHGRQDFKFAQRDRQQFQRMDQGVYQLVFRDTAYDGA